MRLWKVMVVLFTVLYLPSALASPQGRWVTIDDKTGKKRAVVQVSVSGNQLSGRIVNVFKQPGDTGICGKCPGHFKNKKIEGLQFLWGLKKTGENTWSGGKILDPKTGKIYKAKLTEKGNKLHVRGYVGASLFGRTQVWHRQR